MALSLVVRLIFCGFSVQSASSCHLERIRQCCFNCIGYSFHCAKIIPKLSFSTPQGKISLCHIPKYFKAIVQKLVPGKIWNELDTCVEDYSNLKLLLIMVKQVSLDTFRKSMQPWFFYSNVLSYMIPLGLSRTLLAAFHWNWNPLTFSVHSICLLSR